jgi:hypothetical protein
VYSLGPVRCVRRPWDLSNLPRADVDLPQIAERRQLVEQLLSRDKVPCLRQLDNPVARLLDRRCVR